MEAQMKPAIRELAIEETESGWKCSAGWSEPTAFEALARVRSEDSERSEFAVTILTWEPKTRIGRMVVRAIAS